VADVVEEIGVTSVTVRRDIIQLAAEGKLTRVHGGAIAAPRQAELESSLPEATNGASIGLLVPSLAFYWPDVVHSIEADAKRYGLKVALRASSYNAADERPLLNGLARSGGIEGLLLAPRTDGPGSSAMVKWLIEADLPTVLVEREIRNPITNDMFEAVLSDHALGTLMAVYHLASLGHRRVGLVVSQESPTSRRIAAGWRAGCKELGLANYEHFEQLAPHRTNPQFPQAIEEVVETVLKTGTTALLIHSDPEAFAVVQHAQDRGLSVPGQLSVIAYDDVLAGVGSPALTAIRPPREAVAAAAVRQLVRRITDPDSPAQRTLISPLLNPRESTGPAPSEG